MARLEPFEIRPVLPSELPALPELTPEKILARTAPGRWRQRLVQVCIRGASLAPGALLAEDPGDVGSETADGGQDAAEDSTDLGPDFTAVGCMCAPAPGSGQAVWAGPVTALLALLAARWRRG
jgi:hypothetical protein